MADAFFIASKLVWFVIQPLVLVGLFLLLGLALALLGRHGAAWTMAGIGIAGYAIVMFSPLGLLLVGFLEDRIPRTDLPPDVTGIVVLGGSFDTRVGRYRGNVPELAASADRITATVELARRYPQARVIFSGGVAAVFEDDQSEVDAARAMFKALGLAPDRVEMEGRARNTVENAVFTREMAQPKLGETWVLVTSGYHMPRSLGCFRRVGFDVVPYPVDFRTPGGAANWRPSWLDVTRNGEKVQLAAREFIGLAAYYLSGRTDAWLPAASAPAPIAASASGNPSL